MDVVPAVAGEVFAACKVGRWFGFRPEPGVVGPVALGFPATILVPFDVGFGAQQAGAFLADIPRQQERADVESNAVVEIGLPAERLFVQRFPADEQVVGRFAFEDVGQFGLQKPGHAEAFGGAGFVGFGVFLLLAYPVAEVAVGQRLQGGVVEAVIVDQDVKAILAAVPGRGGAQRRGGFVPLLFN